MTLPPLREVIARHGLSASKALGQNFLFDEQLLDRIAAIPGDLAGANVLEVGPGPGGLTRALLRAGAKVTAVEMDRRCLPALAEVADAFPGQLTVIEGDAMKIAPTELFGSEPFATSVRRSNADWVAAVSGHFAKSGLPDDQAERLVGVVDVALMGLLLDEQLDDDEQQRRALADLADAAELLAARWR